MRPAGDLTPYDGIRAVPAAACLSFSASGAHTRQRFYDLNPGTIRFGDPRQYEEQLRALWSDAVGSRLRTDGAVWAELSGGFDSSSVAAWRTALIKQRRVEAPALRTISYVTLESPEGDERRFIAEVEARTGTSSVIVGVEENQGLVDPHLDSLTPLAASGVALAAARHVRDHGGRVVLSGRAGDVVMGCEPDNSVAVLDDLADGHVLTALRSLRRWSRSTKKPFVELAIQLARRGTRSGLARAIERHSARRRTAAVALLTQRLQQMTGDEGELAAMISLVRPAQRELASRLLSYAAGSTLSTTLRPFGVVHTYPFTHRPLVEFVAAIPGEQLSAPGELRWLMRRAFDGLLPARILQAHVEGLLPAVDDARDAHRGGGHAHPPDVWRSSAAAGSTRARLDAAMRTFIDSGAGADAVHGVLRLEHWLESRTRRAPAAIPQRKEVRHHEEVLNA